MKKGKVLTTICMLIMTISCLTFGVFALIKTTFTASGTITFNAYNLDVLVHGQIIGAVENGTSITEYKNAIVSNHGDTTYTASTDGTLPAWTMGDMAFDELNDNNLIIIKFTITNYSKYPIEASATIENQTTLENNMTIQNIPMYYCYDAVYGTDGTVTSNSGELILTFAPKDGVEAFTSDLNISVNITPSQKTPTTEGFETSVSGDEVTITFYTGSDTKIIIPRTIDGKNVVTIGEEAISDCPDITSIIIPETVTTLVDLAFWNCIGLTSITIPSSVTNIGSSVFSSCTSLVTITIPKSVTIIGDWPFTNCNSLASIIVEFGNRNYDSRDNCNAIIETANNTLISGCKNTIIPSSVTSIGNYAFLGSGLTSITIPSSVTSIGGDAFTDCSNLSLTTIGDAGYLTDGANPKVLVKVSNTSITSFEIASTIVSISNSAFKYCRSLTSITIPEGVTSIGGRAFLGCSGLTSITIPSSVTSMGSAAFWGCSGLTSITIKGTSIGDTAFLDCSGLITITISSSVTSIGRQAFSGCSKLTSITIPSSVTSIGQYAFSGCSKLTSVKFENTSNWYVGSSASACDTLVTISATDFSANAKLLKTDHVSKYWQRKSA